MEFTQKKTEPEVEGAPGRVNVSATKGATARERAHGHDIPGPAQPLSTFEVSELINFV
ncbi:hypothetical protein [Streptomyces naganishii]|uniref:hypothetical protein n=1 Tax=Streptomyces naganishii TaxID=285447 RepID=UPI00167C763D|nr:hypothetical protein [Streptomyces naganishii]